MTGNAQPRRIIVLGALSAIGEATARLYAAEGAHLLLAARNRERLDAVAADLQARGAARCVVWPADLANTDEAGSEFGHMVEALGGAIDAVLLFYGSLGDQKAAESDANQFRQVMATNGTSAAEWCLAAANLLEAQRRGVLVAISSVAGDRGRQSNYVYGAAKAALTVLVEGIAHRLAPTGARAAVVKLGFVDTPMTAHIPKGGPLWAKPADVAAKIKAVAETGRKPVVYVPSFWRPIMFVVRNVPAAIFHKTKL